MANLKRKKSKIDEKGRNPHKDRFVKLDAWIMQSPAYRLLSPGARALLLEFMRLYNGQNNGTLFMSQRDAATAVGVKNHQTAARYIQELVKRGFLRVTMPGSFNNKTHTATSYALAMYDVGNRSATKDFMKLGRLTDEERRRAEKLTPPWLKKIPAGTVFIPDEYRDEWENHTCFDKSCSEDGANFPSTYSIPPGQGNGPTGGANLRAT